MRSSLVNSGLLAVTAHILLTSTSLVAASPIALPALAPFRGALFPNSRAASFVEAFRVTDGDNAQFSCSRNGKPCVNNANNANSSLDGGNIDDEEFDGDEDLEGEDDDSTITTGGIDVVEYIDPNGVPRVSIGGEVSNYKKDEYTDVAFSDGIDEDVDGLTAAGADEEEFASTDRTYKCTRNGFPCGTFPEGAQRELTVERTASCTRNGVPCDQFVDGQDEDEKFTINKSKDSYKTCTRNGIPCEEYDRLVSQGETPAQQDQYTVQSGGGNKPRVDDSKELAQQPVGLEQEENDARNLGNVNDLGPKRKPGQEHGKAFQKGKGKSGFRALDVNNK